MSKPSLIVVDWVKKKVLTGLVTVSEAAKLVPGLIAPHSGPGAGLEVISLRTHFDRLGRFARGEWNANKDHLTAYNKRVGWFTESLVPVPVTA